MLNKKGQRELAYVVNIDAIEPIVGSDNCEAAIVGGWKIMTRKGTFQVGDKAVYFEIDSKVPAREPYMFLSGKHFKIKTQKYTFGGKGNFISQGLLMSFNDFGWDTNKYEVGDFLTAELGVVYSVEEDNKRKSNITKYDKMYQRHLGLFKKHKFLRKMFKYNLGKKVLFIFLGKKRDSASGWPIGKFPGVSKTDQERCENMVWVLEDKTPYIVTQKCDGSSGTYILERKGKNKFEFYVCSRNVRMTSKEQECFYGSHNYYWEVAEKYEIERKMKSLLEENPSLKWICWQGEICAPDIQKNPHKLSETHFYCFHWTDNVNGRMDIRDAAKNWENLNMEVVPIVNENYILPDDFEEFKLSADGFYDARVCEGHADCSREGYVYYKVGEPTFSFKNVSREYLAKD